MEGYMFYVTGSVLLAYLIGSIPTGYIFGKVLKGIDIREYGSGNVGATNVFRSVGKVPGIIVLVLDLVKGLVAVTLIPYLVRLVFTEPAVYGSVYLISLGAAAIVGHIWTCFLRFRGGKGVATTAGVMIGLYPVVFFIGLAVWVIFVLIWKYVSLASIAAAVSLPVIALIMGKDIATIVFFSILAILGTYSHRANIKRLLQGTESKIVKVKNS